MSKEASAGATTLVATFEAALVAGEAAAEAEPPSEVFLGVFFAGFLGDLDDIVYGSSLQPGMELNLPLPFDPPQPQHDI